MKLKASIIARNYINPMFLQVLQRSNGGFQKYNNFFLNVKFWPLFSIITFIKHHPTIGVLVLIGKLLKNLHHVVLISIKEEKNCSFFLSNFAKEVMTINNQSWISIHCYGVVGFKLLLILFTLKCLVENGTTTTNIKFAIFFFY